MHSLAERLKNRSTEAHVKNNLFDKLILWYSLINQSHVFSEMKPLDFLQTIFANYRDYVDG
jgi:hypothetical protein